MAFIIKQLGVFLVVAMSVLTSPSMAAGFDNEYDEKPWAEIEVQLPAFPVSEHLIPFQLAAKSDARFFVDGNSISVGSDGVIRFTLVVDSSQGARNISYEGMRCDTAERRFYASGRSDRTWSKARSNRWSGIRGGSHIHYAELYTNFFCTVGAPTVMDAEDARRVLRSGGNSKAAGP